MADTWRVLTTLVDKEDVRRWAAVNNIEPVDNADGSILVGEYTVVFDDYGKVFYVERRAEHNEPTAL
jgi:hypothetical protein